MNSRHDLEPTDAAALLVALCDHLGDASALTPNLHLDPLAGRMPGVGWTDEQSAEAHRRISEMLERLEDQPEPAAPPSPAARRTMIEWLAGGPVSDRSAGMLRDELALDGDARTPSWHVSDVDRPPTRVAVIGAGMSGILAAYRLLQAGCHVIVFEKNSGLGGTWFENVYPGCRVDVPNHVYSYSCAQKADWPFHHSPRPVLHEYFQDCAEQWGVGPHIRFGVEVMDATWDDTTDEWRVGTIGEQDGEHRFDVVVSAVGQLNRPVLPEIEGRDGFEGEAFHTARWRDDVDLSGKRVAVIGTGASAMQVIPEIAPVVEELTVFQRTPAWLVNRPLYHAPLDQGVLDLFERIPAYLHWFRLRRFWDTHQGSLDAAKLDPDWDGPLERSVSEMSELLREIFTGYIEEQFADRPDLLAQVVPNYPVGAKRFILDNGIWAESLKRDNVSLVTDGIDRITASGVETDGDHHDVDVVIYGTGFSASSFLAPMAVVGRGGADLRERWGDDARAYYGMTVPDFPNFFCLYGPNTNIVVNGSIIFFSECAVNYLVESIGQLRTDGLSAMDVRPEVHDAQIQHIDAANSEMVWGLSSVNSWYKSATGRIAQNWPFPLADYWAATQQPDRADYERW
ncbi:MAG: NAD(P)/FAD-dependent oxidoreductase [Acidimicrobiales bacterium]|jgi:4-hydroxyacetophenone monooxygenase|nr:NAD(P)/FAD-dependent oxidoreductase [Acidimicrobiales bacterium]